MFFESEQNVKNTLLLKLLQAMNYPILSDNLHWEYSAGYKSGEKVDCSILKDDTPICIIEVKNIKERLDSKSVQNQLKGYFDSLLTVKYAISFNGKEMRIYTDLDHENLMDEFPFHIIDFSNVTDEDVKVLRLLSSDNLLNDHMALYQKASELKLKSILKNTDSFKKSLANFIKNQYGIRTLSDSQVENIISQIMKNKIAV